MVEMWCGCPPQLGIGTVESPVQGGVSNSFPMRSPACVRSTLVNVLQRNASALRYLQARNENDVLNTTASYRNIKTDWLRQLHAYTSWLWIRDPTADTRLSYDLP